MRRTLVLIALAGACGPPAAPAQPPPEPSPVAITLRPAAEPSPALKYQLVPEWRALEPGNAAIFYHRGIQLLIQTRMRLAGPGPSNAVPRAASVDERIADWVNAPIATIPRDEARRELATFEAPLHEAELGAARRTCDWEFDQRREGFALMLPEIQEMRSLARLVALRARLAIRDGKTDEAMHWIETGLVMGRHVSQGPTLIQLLVGVAIDSVMAKCLEDLIQAPGTPSLYWALADRPRPFVDPRHPIEGERYLLEKQVPELTELERGPWSLNEARQFVEAMERKLIPLASGQPKPGGGGSAPAWTTDLARRLGIAAMAARVYPEARRALIAGGLSEAEVEAMPVVQAAALYSYREYQKARDGSYKWLNVPYWQSYNRIDGPALRTAQQKLASPLLTLFWMVMPNLNSARIGPLRLERQLDALQCIEAIRLHAHAHGGKLPETLEAITDAPVPLDPATGKPFSYRLEGDSATLSAPFPPGGPNRPAYAIRYVLTLAR